MNVNFMTAFSSVVGKEKFLSIDSFCSEEFKGSVNTECSRRLDPLSPGESLSEMTITCVAEKNSEKRSYLAVFNSTNKTVSVSCKANETETFVGIFNACHSALVDYKKFGAF